MHSKMFLANLTIIDHAYVDKQGNIVGGSFNPSFIVEGEIDETEQVVIDFSTCKKDIKNIIDSKENGLDHKLWIGGFSTAQVAESAEQLGYVITTPKWKIEVPENAVHFFNEEFYDVDSIGAYISELVTNELRKKYPTIKVTCYNTIEAHGLPYAKFKAPFRYTHGLKNSTSWGCQNIAHGHLSYISILGEDEIGCNALAQKIASDLDGVMFIWSKNETVKGLEYETERGVFRLTHESGDAKVHFSSSETTIENLVAMIVSRYYSELKSVWADEVHISEGLSKGAVYNVK